MGGGGGLLFGILKVVNYGLWIPKIVSHFRCSTLLVVATLLAFSDGQATAVQASVMGLNRGEPGCQPVVSAQAISDAAAKRLSPQCQEYRDAYSAMLEIYSKSRSRFVQELKSVILNAKDHRSPYRALVFAVLSGEKELIAPIQKRAHREAKLKVKWPYAKVALERLQSQKCSKQWLEDSPKDSYAPSSARIFSELCLGYDPAFVRMKELHAFDSRKIKKPKGHQ